jgi:GTP-binding protein EngB required for normal cell division
LRRLQARLEEGRLRVAVLGQFKRGKSTLLNALLGVPLLPTGITPVTAIPTFIKAGPKTAARITFKGGKEPLLSSDEAEIRAILEQHISETGNPRNRLGVESVELEARSEFLDQGITLADTPGVGSTFLHQTQAAEAVLTECDVAVFVVSADPPITGAEVSYLAKVQQLIPKIFFALNKIDLLESRERGIAERFLANVLQEQPAIAQPARIFCVSARQGLQAKQDGDFQALAASGIQHLEQVLAAELAGEKQTIVLTTGRQRSISLIGELLFQSELEYKAMLMPEEDLKRKAATFESSMARFESERQTLSGFLAVDRKQLLKELKAETDRLWGEAQKELRQLIVEIAARPVNEQEARDRFAMVLTQYFDQALHQLVDRFRAALSERLAVHQERAGALIALVRRTAADLMEISAALPRPQEAFEVKLEPYWVAPEASVSLLDMSASAVTQLMPKSIREKWARDRLAADAEKAALRNLANLNEAIRRNLEEAFRRFELSLTEQLGNLLQATRQAMQLAIGRRTARAEEISEYLTESARSIASLSNILSELQALRPAMLQEA